MPNVHSPRLVAAAAVIVVGVFCTVVFSQKPSPVVGGNPPNASSTAPLPVGRAGCSATGCHGRTGGPAGDPPADVWHDSYTRWIDRDPHVAAYAVLTGDLGNHIMRRLHNIADDSPLPPDKSANRDSRCVACHANPSLATVDSLATATDEALRQEGVSCEACHGNAEKWQLAHVGWLSPTQRSAGLESTGMFDLNPPTARATACAGCHIGAPADPAHGHPVRDMNHDMIAAGHPRLEFDFAAFQSALPKHWYERPREPSTPTGAERGLIDWYVGQLAVEQAAANLTHDRTVRSKANDPRTPFPELSDWNCAQCHHSLVPNGWRKSAAKADGPRRSLGYPLWNASGLGGRSLTPTPLRFQQSPEEQATGARSFQEKLTAEIKAGTADPAAGIQNWLEAITANQAADRCNWDEAVRLTTALTSLHETLSRSGRPSPSLIDLQNALTSAVGYKSLDPESPLRHQVRELLAKGDRDSEAKTNDLAHKRFGEVAAKVTAEMAEKLKNLPAKPRNP